MPKKDFLVTVTITDEKISAISLATTSAYPDVSIPYVLTYGANAFGRNILSIRLNENGLLTSVSSTTTSEVAETLQNLAVPTNGRSRIIDKSYDESESAPPARHGCGIDGIHTFIHKAEGDYLDCGLTISIKKYGESSKITPHAITENQAISGIFYRQNLPYLMTAKGQGIKAATIVFSPSEAKTQFIPASKTFFADNDASFGFTDGVLTQYRQDTNGEFTALFTLPAEILSAYFGAAGKIFPSFGNQQNTQQTTGYQLSSQPTQAE